MTLSLEKDGQQPRKRLGKRIPSHPKIFVSVPARDGFCPHKAKPGSQMRRSAKAKW